MNLAPHRRGLGGGASEKIPGRAVAGLACAAPNQCSALPRVHSHFDYFIPNEGRFKPSQIKNYEYSCDWKESASSKSKSKLKSKSNIDEEIYKVNMNELKDSSIRLCNAAVLLGKEIKHLLKIHDLDHLHNNENNNNRNNNTVVVSSSLNYK